MYIFLIYIYVYRSERIVRNFCTQQLRPLFTNAPLKPSSLRILFPSLLLLYTHSSVLTFSRDVDACAFKRTCAHPERLCIKHDFTISLATRNILFLHRYVATSSARLFTISFPSIFNETRPERNWIKSSFFSSERHWTNGGWPRLLRFAFDARR